VRGAKSLALSGEVADGTILVEGSTPSYVKWARERIDEGRRNASRTDDHQVTVYAIWGQDVAGPGEVEALAQAGADAVVVVPNSDPAAAERELEQAAGTLGLS
jgi:hypothetical protein